jgi:hypothetical protein
MKQKITGFHQDEECHWVADLECGHKQHMRHDPPWMDRTWVLTPEGRETRINTELDCKRCDSTGLAVGEAVRAAILKHARDAVEDAGIRGLCSQGQIDLLWDSLQTIDLRTSIEEAIRQLVENERKAIQQGEKFNEPGSRRS